MLVAMIPLIVGMRRVCRRFLFGSSGRLVRRRRRGLGADGDGWGVRDVGTFGGFRRLPMCVRSTVGVARVLPWSDRCGAVPRRRGRDVLGTGARIVAALAVGLVVASWVARTAASLRQGMETVDTIWYHMPTSARFVQIASTTRLHFLDPLTGTAFYPATSPLLHALGIQWLGNDFLSPFLDLGWMAFGLLAAWSIGEQYGVGPSTLIAGAVVLATPGFVATQPGGAYTDVAGVALLLAAVSLLLSSDSARRTGRAGSLFALALAALAAGLAGGMKFTLLAPVGVLTVAVLAVVLRRHDARRSRWLEALLWCVLLLTAGGYFYVRNLARVGNPLPSLSFGPLDLPTSTTEGEPVARYMLRSSIWRTYYLPGLWDSLGPAWWAILVLAIGGGILVAVCGRTVLEHALGFVAVAAVAAFVFGPQYLGFPGSARSTSCSTCDTCSRHWRSGCACSLPHVPSYRRVRAGASSPSWLRSWS